MFLGCASTTRKMAVAGPRIRAMSDKRTKIRYGCAVFALTLLVALVGARDGDIAQPIPAGGKMFRSSRPTVDAAGKVCLAARLPPPTRG